jgi:ATP-dependent RNA helicase SUPV3L1/SUV3
MIFYNITKVISKDTQKNSDDTMNDGLMGPISTSQALQISGRAGRYNTNFSKGFVTTISQNDLVELLNIIEQPLDPLSKAFIHPMSEQIEQFSYFLP